MFVRTACVSLALSSLVPFVALYAQNTEERKAPADSADVGAATSSNSRQPLPIEISGYLSVREMRGESPSLSSFREYAGSLFLSKTYKHWDIHTELNVEHSPDFDGDGIVFGPPNIGAHLHTAWLNYKYRDWLNARGGFLHVPTYWRTHRYQSTTLTLEEPLIDMRIFPSALIGGMIHGSTYFENSGISYTLYSGGGLFGGQGFDSHNQLHSDAGSSSGSEATTTESSAPELKHSRAIGGTFIYHFPSHQFFQTLDFGVHRLQISYAEGNRQSIYGFESHVEKERLSFLGEYAHASANAADGSRYYFREGYYLQPSLRITPKLFGVYRFDWINADSRSETFSNVKRHTTGLTFRPIPAVSLKLEYVRHRFGGSESRAHDGLSAGVVYYFLFR